MTSDNDNPQTIPNRSDNSVETANVSLSEAAELFERDNSQVPSHADFWCISLTVVEQGVEMVINISGSVMLGRSVDSKFDGAFIDLSGYNAHEHGVSRQHAIITLRNKQVVIKDNNSANNTLLNNKKLRPMQEYALTPGDLISLGKLQLQFNLLFDPFA